MNTIRRLQIATLGPILALAGLALVAWAAHRDLRRAQENRHDSHLLATELRRSSDELTRLARTYVVTGDPGYERQFWNVLAVRNGTEPRPDGRHAALRTLMAEQGFTPAEFAKLKEAEDNSNTLVTTEAVAMHAMKGQFADGKGEFTKRGPADPDLARRIMHDADYHAAKDAIMRPIGEFEAMLDRRTAAAVATARGRSDAALLLGIVVAALAAVIAAFALRRHATELREAAAGIGTTSAFVSTGATQVAAASRALADGTAEQVAAVERITASARDLGGTVADAARRTQSASEQVHREREELEAVRTHLGALVAAMGEIETAADSISRINKVIDEIAFQTNILALNAAVEAARAGEAGQGFGVVADEVRNLARRSTEAARETAALIEQSIGRTRSGREQVDAVAHAVAALAGQAAGVQALVEEVRRGSGEQRATVDRIGTSLASIERTAAQAAAGAEEGSAAAEQLMAQAAGLRDVAATLEAMVGSRTPRGAGS